MVPSALAMVIAAIAPCQQALADETVLQIADLSFASTDMFSDFDERAIDDRLTSGHPVYVVGEVDIELQ
jgi:hypothetical protein